MSKGAYTYEPGNITEFGKDRMRFELGDTMVEGLADTTALTDEEIQAAIDAYPKKWKRAKLMLLESLCRRFAYEVNTKTGPLSLDMNGRAKLSEERVVYKECIPSGQIDIQNVTVGDVIKRNWNFFVNRPPKLQSLLGVDR